MDRGACWGPLGCVWGRARGARWLLALASGGPRGAPCLQPALGPAAVGLHSGTFAGAERRCVSSALLLASGNCFLRGLLHVLERASPFASWGNAQASLVSSKGASAFRQIQVSWRVGEVHGESRNSKDGGEAFGGSCQG